MVAFTFLFPAENTDGESIDTTPASLKPVGGAVQISISLKFTFEL